MKPIGLTLKDIKYNPFTNSTSGELKIVHLCTNCHKIATNRIAGDDNTYSIISLLNESPRLDITICNRVSYLGITLLTNDDMELIQVILFGYQY